MKFAKLAQKSCNNLVKFLVSFEGTWNSIVPRKSMGDAWQNLGNPLLWTIKRGSFGLCDWSTKAVTGSVLYLSQIQLRVSSFVHKLAGFRAVQMTLESRALSVEL